jgi:hypothetical protein
MTATTATNTAPARILFVGLLVLVDAVNSSLDEKCAMTAIKRRCKNLGGCRWHYKSKICVSDTEAAEQAELTDSEAEWDLSPEDRSSTYCSATEDPVACDTKIFCQWDYQTGRSGPKLVYEEGTCQVGTSNTASGTKELGAQLTLLECSAAVQVGHLRMR